MRNHLYDKLLLRRVWKRLYFERLGEPLVYQVASLGALLFGTYEQKIKYDLVPRQPYACGLDIACRIARQEGVTSLIAIEFGVAAGGGLLNLACIAKRLERVTGISFRVVGFDTGTGMPPASDYRDHPEMYREGDFPQPASLVERLPPNAELRLGRVEDQVETFVRTLPPESRIGFIAMDLDYYSSTKAALAVLLGEAQRYLSRVPMYFDDVLDIGHNPFCGELLAISEFNAEHRMRKIAKWDQLKHRRVFRRAPWIDQMYCAYILDHPYRSPSMKRSKRRVLDNPYL